jgi:hypothetical protein
MGIIWQTINLFPALFARGLPLSELSNTKKFISNKISNQLQQETKAVIKYYMAEPVTHLVVMVNKYGVM